MTTPFSSSDLGFVFRLTGWRAVMALIVAAVLLTARYGVAHKLPVTVEKQILLRLKADYTAPVIQKFDGAKRDRETLKVLEAEMQRAQRIGLEEVTVRGILWPQFVRVVVSVDGKEPPDGRRVRYFTISALGVISHDVSGSQYYFSPWSF